MKRIAIIGLALSLMIGVSYQIQKNLKLQGVKTGNSPSASVEGVTPNTVPGADSKVVTTEESKVNGNSPVTHSPGTDSPLATETTGKPAPAAQSQNSQTETTQVKTDSANHGALNPGAFVSNPVAAGTALTHNTQSPATPELPKEDCFAFEYKHKKEAKNRDIEEFLDLTNAFPLLHANYNPKTICVKVNDQAVNFQMAKMKGVSEVRVGSVVGPDSIIHVSYCVGKVTCKESCATPKKRFMDDLMSDAGDDDSFADSWGKGDDAHKKELKTKAKELRAVASENQNLNEGSVVRTWDTVQKQEWVCKDSQKRKDK